MPTNNELLQEIAGGEYSDLTNNQLLQLIAANGGGGGGNAETAGAIDVLILDETNYAATFVLPTNRSIIYALREARRLTLPADHLTGYIKIFAVGNSLPGDNLMMIYDSVRDELKDVDTDLELVHLTLTAAELEALLSISDLPQATYTVWCASVSSSLVVVSVDAGQDWV